MNLKICYICIIVIAQFCFTNSRVFSEENNGFEIKFSNTVFVEHFSDVLYNDIRTEQNTLRDQPSFYLNEKFKMFYVDSQNQNNEDIQIACLSIPSSVYISTNFLYTHYENFAIRIGLEGEIGFGDYKNPFISGGIGLAYLNDMIFNSSEYNKINYFLNIGYRDDMHFFYGFSGPLIESDYSLRTFRDYQDVDITLGYKSFLPIFLRLNAFYTKNDTEIDENTDSRYSYGHTVMFTHLQYYGNYYGISAGYSGNMEWYYKEICNANRSEIIDEIKIDSTTSHGGGFTFYVKDIASFIELFGEFHLLADSDMNWMTISKFGAKAYF